jgi:hypothetical protein
MGEIKYTNFESKIPKVRESLGDLGLDKRIILKWALKE